jgi:peptide/nickel transport system substrate-binding protein
MMRYITLGFVLAVLIAASATPEAILGAPASQSITVVHGSEPFSLSPPMDVVKTSVNIQLALFDPLLFANEKAQIQPSLATEWSRISAGVWRFRLRPGVKFHNGEEFNADSVVFSLETYKQLKGQAASFFAIVAGARAIDRYTVEFATTQPTATIPALMTFFYPMPKGYFSQVGPERFAASPIGTGAFQFVEWVRGSHIRVRRNPNYWADPAKVNEITFRWAADATTRAAMLESKQADIIVGVPAQMVSRIRGAGQRALQVRSMRKMFVAFNTLKPPFNDVRIRQAVAAAVNADEIVSTVVSGAGVRTPGLITPYFEGHDPKAPKYAYNPDEAKRLLAAAGFPNGLTVNFYHPIGRYAYDREVAAAIAGQLSRVGINTNIRGLEGGAFFNFVIGRNVEAEGMHLYAHAPLYPDEDAFVRVPFHSQGLYKYTGSPETDRMIDEAAALESRTQRVTAYRALERYLMEQRVAWVPLYDFIDIYGVSSRVLWSPRPDEIADLRRVSVR